MLASRVAALVVALASPPAAEPELEPTSEPGLLTLAQAAEIAALSPEAFRRRRAFRPAIVALGHRTLRVDERRLRRILANLART